MHAISGRQGVWRRRPESNRCGRICNPLRHHSATSPKRAPPLATMPAAGKGEARAGGRGRAPMVRRGGSVAGGREMWHSLPGTGWTRRERHDRLRRGTRDHGGSAGPDRGCHALPDHRGDARGSARGLRASGACGRSPTSASTSRSAPGRVLLDPRVFAKMLDAVNVGPGDLVLDVGCGYGYSTAVLAKMAEAVVALEADEAMAAEAEALLAAQGVDTAVVHDRSARRGRGGAWAFRRDDRRGRDRGPAAGARGAAEAGRTDRGDLRRRRPRPGAARPAGPRPGSRGGVSSMQRRRSFPASRRRKRLSSERGRPIVVAEPGERVRGVGSRRGKEMNRLGFRTILLAGTLLTAGLVAVALPTGARRRQPRRRHGEGLPDQPSARRQPRRAAQPRRERPPGPRRPAAAGQRRPPAPRRARRPRTSRTDRLDSIQAQLQASLVIFDSGSTKAAIEFGAQPDRRRAGRPQGRRAARALQRRPGLRRCAPRRGVRAPRRQRRRPPERDAARHPEPLRRRRGHADRRQPEPVAPRGLALAARVGQGRARRSRARPTARRWAPFRASCSRCLRCRPCRTRSTSRSRSA